MATPPRLAVIIRKPSKEDEFLLYKQNRPPKFNHEEYDSYVDSDLWDLPCTELNLSEAGRESEIVVEVAENCFSEDFDLRKFDMDTALKQVFGQLGFETVDVGEWKLWKYVKEVDFGPGMPIHTVFITGELVAENQHLEERCKWMSLENCLKLLLDVKPCDDRIGILAVIGLLNDAVPSNRNKFSSNYQEYPPGIMIMPMGSKTQKPFDTTNLIVLAPMSVPSFHENNDFVAYGDALIVDPGCQSKFHAELQEIVAALPQKLVVFVTHHHRDHVDGLSVVQKSNPNAVLLAHKNTMNRIEKGDWSADSILVSGSEEICIAGQRLRVISAPGHTDGHMALLHVSTHSLIVGDHCVGQGSALLDITSGGNMTEYFQSTYKFMDLSPHVLIPMHGRVNVWPKHMLSGYLKNRRDREASILKAIEGGATTLFDIVANVYSEVDHKFWIAAASNVRLHVDHLAEQQKLPKEFSMKNFQKTCKLRFMSRWLWEYIVIGNRLGKWPIFVAGSVAGFSVIFSISKFGN